jgi:hypothetical protein
MTNANNHDKEVTRMVVNANDAMPMVDCETVELGANPREAITVKAWDPGKPPGGKMPPETKAQTKKS